MGAPPDERCADFAARWTEAVINAMIYLPYERQTITDDLLHLVIELKRALVSRKHVARTGRRCGKFLAEGPAKNTKIFEVSMRLLLTELPKLADNAADETFIELLTSFTGGYCQALREVTQREKDQFLEAQLTVVERSFETRTEKILEDRHRLYAALLVTMGQDGQPILDRFLSEPEMTASSVCRLLGAVTSGVDGTNAAQRTADTGEQTTVGKTKPCSFGNPFCKEGALHDGHAR